MDFLDPKKQRRSRIILSVGYVLIAAAIGIATLILLYQAYGFGLDKNGNVIQNGLVFFSSHPSGADIYIDNVQYKSQTNTRILLPADNYNIRITKDGYRDWTRSVTVVGGTVEHYDYPFLFPKTLATDTLATYASAPDFASQSPDRRWLVVDDVQPGSFILYDLKDASKPQTGTLVLPAAAYTKTDGTESWTAVQWSSDNRHLLLRHDYTASGQSAHEYVLLDRQTPADSLNMTAALQLAATASLRLWNDKYNQFYVFDQTAGTLGTATLDAPVVTPKLSNVVAYKPYGNDIILYVTDQPAIGQTAEGAVRVVLQQGQNAYTIRTLPAGAPHYLLDMAHYGDDSYVVAGASTGAGVYIYKNPQNQRSGTSNLPTVLRLLKINQPNYVSFSDTAQFIVAENGQNFEVFDTKTNRSSGYAINSPLDAPQQHAAWMDGNRLMYVSGGQLVVFDYDSQNYQPLEASLPQYQSFFSSNYGYVFSLTGDTAADGAGRVLLTTTPLTVPSK